MTIVGVTGPFQSTFTMPKETSKFFISIRNNECLRHKHSNGWTILNKRYGFSYEPYENVSRQLYLSPFF